MPLIEVNTWPTMSTEEKKEFIFTITELTTNLLKIVPDKIQILTKELEKENWEKLEQLHLILALPIRVES